jgi:hypothetical protein
VAAGSQDLAEPPVLVAPTKPVRVWTTGAWAALWPLAGYIALSLLLWGRLVLGSMGSESLAGNDGVPSAFMWLFEWWPHALLHGVNPLWTHVILIPAGVNLTWITSVPGLSLAFAPVTLAFGPVVTWNVIALLAPALAAWTAFLLCHHVTRSLWPSLLGGLLFGFSPYVVGHLDGLPQLSFVALVPLIVLLVVRRMDGTLGERPFVVWMAVALAAQFSISTEVLLTTGIMGAIVLAAALLAFPERRPALVGMLKLLALALAGMALLVSPFIFYALARAHTAPDYTYFGVRADLLSWVVPNPRLDAFAVGSHDYGAGFGYVGIPLLVLLVLFARESWRTTTGRLVVIALAVAALASLGGSLIVARSHTGVPLPWGIIDGLPLVKYALPVRLSLYVFLAAALALAMWLAARQSAARWALAVVALLALVPNVFGSTDWTTRAVDPPFFSSGQFHRYLSEDDRVLAIPAVGASMRWQANAGFDFKLAGGGFASYGRSYTDYPIWIALVFGQPTASAGDALYRFTHDHGVTAVVVDRRLRGHWRSLMGTLGARPRELGGVLFYRLGPSGLPVEPARVIGAKAGAFTLAGDQIRSPTRTYRIVRAPVSGFTDSSLQRPGGVKFIGWVGELEKGHPARTVLLFSGTRLVAVTPADVPREDVGKQHPELASSGYQVTVPLGLLQDRGTRPPFRAFGLDDRGNAIAMHVICNGSQQYIAC